MKNEKIILKVSNLRSKLITDNSELTQVLIKKYSRKIQGYGFTSAYRNSNWSGETYFFTAAGGFGTGLLPNIIKDLKIGGFEYEIQDARILPNLIFQPLKGFKLRDYQERMIKKALSLHRCIIESPTGTGKTLMIASIIKSLEGKKGILFFTKQSILVQTYDFLQDIGIDVGIAFGQGYVNKDIMLCTVQSVEKIIDTHLDSEFVMFDEVHEFAGGKVTKAVLTGFPRAAIRMGFTATIPSDPIKKLTLRSALGIVVNEGIASDMVDKGWLTSPIIQLLDLPDTTESKDVLLTYPEVYSKFIVNNEARNNYICDIIKYIAKTNETYKILIIVNSLKHANILNKLIPNSVKLEGKDSVIERKDEVKKFKGKDKAVIIGTIIFQTGIDIPEITHFINARGLKSDISTVQALGRALRKHESKKNVFIYDFIDKARYIQSHAKKRIKAYKKLGFEVKILGTRKRKEDEEK